MSKEDHNEMRLCFVGNLASTFIKRDYEILKKHFEVASIEPPKKKLGWLKYVITVAQKVKRSDLTFSWFAGWHSLFAVFFSKIFRKRSIVVAVGYYAAYVPEIDYGAFTNLKEKIPAKYVLKNADLVLAVSEFTKNKILEIVKTKQLKVIYNGVDVEQFKPLHEKENMVVTVGNVTKKGITLKGLETYAKASTNFLDYTFIIIGKKDDSSCTELKKINPNIMFSGQISHDEVLKQLQRAGIYCQLSYVESFGVGVAEAMSCSCIPIVTDSGGLPEVVGDAGFYVPYGDEKATAEAIRKALKAPDTFGKKARERVANNYTLKQREQHLVSILEEL